MKPCLVFADGYKITQITNNDYPDAGVEIYNSKIAWQSHPGGLPNPEIFYYDGEDTIRLTYNDTYDCTPSISSGGIVWQGYRSDRGSDIFFYDFNSVKRLTDDIKNDFRVNIYDDKVVWSKERGLDGEIMVYEEGDVKKIDGAYGIFPRVSSSGIMYSDILNDQLYFYNWDSIIGLGDSDVEYTQHAHNQQIGGTGLVWRRHVNGYHEVFLYSISTGTVTKITNKEANPASRSRSYKPSIRGRHIAWINREEELYFLRLYDGNQVSTITSAGLISEPYFGDGFLVWAMTDSDKIFSGTETFVYDLKSKEITQITNDNQPDYYPIASGTYIAWQKYDGNDWEIYLAEILK